MTDHFALAVTSMGTADILRDSLQAAYDHKPTDVREVAKLNSDLRYALAMAKLHASLADVQATYDLRAVVEQLAKDLNAEPEPPPGRSRRTMLGDGRIVALPERES